MSTQALLRSHVRVTLAQPSLPARRIVPAARPSARDLRVRAETEPQPAELEVRLWPGAHVGVSCPIAPSSPPHPPSPHPTEPRV